MYKTLFILLYLSTAKIVMKFELELCEVACDLFPRCKVFNCICQFTDHACGVHEFRCDDGACIRTKFVCDGHEDCMDGLDEKDCSMYLTFYSFFSFPSRISFCEYKLLLFYSYHTSSSISVS